MLRTTNKTHAYVSYEAKRANEISYKIDRLARRAGMHTTGSRRHWGTVQGGNEMYAAGIGGALTGRGINGMIVVDDPHKNRAETESYALRQKVIDFYRSVAISGVHPEGSAIVVHSRWHPDDLIGTLINEGGYELINLAATVNDQGEPDLDGEPLWPEKYSKEFLTLRRYEMGEYDWASLMMGSPRTRGAQVFRDVYNWITPPPSGFRISIGIDMAYTSKTSSDYSVAIVMAEYEGTFWILDVKRMQCSPPEFCSTLRELKAAWPGARMLWHASGVEKGLADTLRELLGFPLMTATAIGDKFTRAQGVAAQWNQGKVLVPNGPDWVGPFVTEITSFTGAGDKTDDQVDALVSAYTQLDRSVKMNDVRPQLKATKFEHWRNPEDELGLTRGNKTNPRFQW